MSKKSTYEQFEGATRAVQGYEAEAAARKQEEREAFFRDEPVRVQPSGPTQSFR